MTAPTGVVAEAPQTVTAPCPLRRRQSGPAACRNRTAKVNYRHWTRYSDQDATVYPAMSRRLGEEGTTVYSVLIGTDGKAIQRAFGEIQRWLDKTAYDDTVMRRRYTPGTRDGVPVALIVQRTHHLGTAIVLLTSRALLF
jgi:protein TonB